MSAEIRHNQQSETGEVRKDEALAPGERKDAGREAALARGKPEETGKGTAFAQEKLEEAGKSAVPVQDETGEEEKNMASAQEDKKETGKGRASSHKKEERYSYSCNRELSWLSFNQRVLEEGAKKDVPLLERLKFLAIFQSNLDEFFMVRVGRLYDLAEVSPDAIDNKTGWTPDGQIREIRKKIPDLIKRRGAVYQDLMKELAREGIEDVPMENLNPQEQAYLDEEYRESILPILTPQIVGMHHPVPMFKSKVLYVALLLRSGKGKYSIGFVPKPDDVPGIILLPNSGRYVRTEELIRERAGELFTQYTAVESAVMCVTRNADVRFDEEKFEDDDFRDAMSGILKRRQRQRIIRLEVDRRLSGNFYDRLLRITGVKPEEIYIDHTPLNMKYAFALQKLLPKAVSGVLSYRDYTPVRPKELPAGKSMIRQIQEADRLLFFPFDSVDPFLDLLQEAADSEDVLSIKITIYRLADTSKIARLLCRAAENGKQVFVVMELRARFDEASNIAWSRVMEDAGCEVIYGVRNYKCHSKICLITLRHEGRVRYITQIGTGNYNEKTNRQYTDLMLMTASQEIGQDGNAFFQNINTNNLEGVYQKLAVSPMGIRNWLCRRIDEQIRLGREGYICIKANGLTERVMIDKLCEASRAGVHIDLIIRGICCIQPGVPGYTENVHVRRIVGRYLEHARIYWFGRGEDSQVSIGSADLMTRNLLHRIEIACPVEDPRLKQQLRWILENELQDESEHGGFSSQEEFMDVSLHDVVPYQSPQSGVQKAGESEAKTQQTKENDVAENQPSSAMNGTQGKKTGVAEAAEQLRKEAAAGETEKTATESEVRAAAGSQAAESEAKAAVIEGKATESEAKAAVSESKAAEGEVRAADNKFHAAESKADAAGSESKATESKSVKDR